VILYVVSDRASYSANAGRKLREIRRTWQELGHEVELVCGGDTNAADPAAPAAAAAAKPRNPLLVSTPDLHGLHAPLVHSVSEWRDLQHDRRLAPYLERFLAGRTPELIWHRASRIHVAPLALAEKLGVPYVLEWIDRLVSYPLSLFHRKAVGADQRRMRAAHRVVVTSERWKQEVAKEYAIPPEKILVAQNAANPDDFVRDPQAGARVREHMGIPADALVVGFVGSYGWYHEADLVAIAASRLRQLLPRPVYFLMVGDGPHRAKLDAVVHNLGVDDLVRRQLAVPQPEVPQWLSAMDAGVVPASGGEIICPMKVQEYMSAGLAPIVADSAANREVVTENETGLFFRSSDADSMAAAISRLAQRPGWAAELGRAGREDVLTRFTWRETFGRALQQIVTEPGGSLA